MELIENWKLHRNCIVFFSTIPEIIQSIPLKLNWSSIWRYVGGGGGENGCVKGCVSSLITVSYSSLTNDEN